MEGEQNDTFDNETSVDSGMAKSSVDQPSYPPPRPESLRFVVRKLAVTLKGANSQSGFRLAGNEVYPLNETLFTL